MGMGHTHTHTQTPHLQVDCQTPHLQIDTSLASWPTHTHTHLSQREREMQRAAVVCSPLACLDKSTQRLKTKARTRTPLANMNGHWQTIKTRKWQEQSTGGGGFQNPASKENGILEDFSILCRHEQKSSGLRDVLFSSAGAGRSCVFPMRVHKPSPALDNNKLTCVHRFYHTLGLRSPGRY